jgi:hypothetical protein
MAIDATVNMGTAGLAAAGSLAFFFTDYDKATAASCDPAAANLAAAGRRRLVADTNLIMSRPELLRLAELNPVDQHHFLASDLFMGAKLWDESEEAAYAQSLHERRQLQGSTSTGASTSTPAQGKNPDELEGGNMGDDFCTQGGALCFEVEACSHPYHARVCVATWSIDLSEKGVFKKLAEQMDVGIEAAFGFGMLDGEW